MVTLTNSTPPWTSALDGINTSITPLNPPLTTNIITTPQMVIRRRHLGPRYGIGDYRAGCRVPVIETKLMELAKRAVIQPVSTSFSLVQIDDVIDIFGKYNPMYSGRPKALALKLLNAAAGQVKDNWLSSLCSTGLFYQTPALTGVRSTRMLTSIAGLALLDHWAAAFPAFKPFVDAYVPKKMRRMISSDCFDMVHGKTPTWMEEEIEKNKERMIKWEAREYRRIKKEEARAKEKADRDAMGRLLSQQAARDQAEYYRQQVYGNSNTGIQWGVTDGF